MSLEQLLRDAAHGIGDGLAPTEVDLGRVRARAQASRRRTTALAAAAAVLAVVAGASIAEGRLDSSPQPVKPNPTPVLPTPSPTSSPSRVPPKDAALAEEIVRSGQATVGVVGVSDADPDTRLAIWRAAGGSAITVTTDGFRTATYTTGPRLRQMVRARSITDDLFLLSDINDTVELLVGTDGSVREVRRMTGQERAADDRFWYQCNGGELWRSTWCALDPTTATASMWPEAWDGSAVPPIAGAEPWGANPRPRSVGATGQLEVWWGSGGERQVRTLASATYGDYVLDCPADVMALWSSSGGAVTIHTSRDGGANWETETYEASADQWWKVRCAPDGSYLSFDSERGTTVWHTQGGAFRQVLAADGSAGSIGNADLWTYDDVAIASGQGLGAISDDSGLTWTRIEKWR
jgi:hypothetical protein